MKRETIKCKKCQKFISKSNYKRHTNSCGNKKYNLKISEEWKISENNYKCPYCSKNFSKMGIITHILRIHIKPELFENSKNKTPRIAWNKGLTKETDNRVKKGGETFKNKLKNGEIKSTWKGKKHTKETKIKIGQKLSKNNNGGRCKWFKYTKKDGIEINLQGTWEVRFAKVLDILDKNWIKIGIGTKGHSYIWKDDNNIEHYYTPDFFSPKLNKYFEVKGYWWGDDKNKMKKVIEQNKNIKIEIIRKKELIAYEKLII